MNTVIHSEVDFNLEGKHTGYLRIPHSVHRSAYGWIPVPIASIKNGTGPKVFLSAGTHGDEYEGQVVLSRLIRELEPEQINGQIIIMPMANFPAAQAGLRTSPIDDLNLNRIFPGNASGTPTEMIAHYTETELLRGVDYYLDVHSGGSSLEYIPVALYEQTDSPENEKRQSLVLDSLALPFSLYCGKDTFGWYTTSAAKRNGACAFTIELGGNGQINPKYTKLFHESLMRMLSAIGCYSTGHSLSNSIDNTEKTTTSTNQSQHVKASAEQRIYAYTEGLFEPLINLGDEVKDGDTVALIHSPATPGQAPIEVIAPKGGKVLCQRVLAQVQRGDCLFELVSDLEPSLT
jgi:predicted deacylase